MGSTFEYDESLPPLPVPTLEETCRKYLNSVKPHVTPEELLRTEFIVNMFAAGEGKQLQEKLKQKSRRMKNWLDDWWEPAAYLTVRTPIAIHSNIGGQSWLESKWPPLLGSRCERATLWVYSALEFFQLLRRETLPPHVIAGKRLAMNQFRSLFACTRVPSPSVDRLHRHFKTASEGPCPRHLMVASNGHVYSVDVICEDESIISISELKQQFSWIESHSKSIGRGPGVSALTTTNRDIWAKNWKHLVDISSTNKEILDVIDKALICVTFSDATSGTINENAHQAMCGDVHNSWFDKSLSGLFNADGTFGSNNEHSPADGLTYLTFSHFVEARLQYRNWTYKGSEAVRKLPQPRHLQFILNPMLCQAIESAVKDYSVLASNLDVKIIDSDIYSKQKAKLSHLRGDSVVQLALQLAYRRLHNMNAPTYESAMTQKFYHGRTETVRSCTPESSNWTTAMLDPKCTKQAKLSLLEKAADAHLLIVEECQNGRGCDRHLLGLQLLAVEEGIPTPSIFTDKSWKASGGGGNFVLSTSSVAGTKFCGGFAPMVEHGYGACYTILPDRFRCQVTSWRSCVHTDSSAFCEELLRSLHDIQDLLSSERKARL